MAITTTNIRAYQNGAVYTVNAGVTGTPLPTDATTALNAAFRDLGSITDDGITDTTNQDTTDVYAWQGNALVKTLYGNYSKQFKVAAQETNGVALGLAYAGSTITQQAWGISIAEKPIVQDIRPFIIHGISDSGKLQRIVIPQGQVVERGDIVWSSKDITVYEFTVRCYVDTSGNVAYRYLYDSTLTV